MTTTKQILWNDNGQLACEQHAPYKASDIWRIGGWRSMTRVEAEEFEREVGHAPDCETCRTNKRLAFTLTIGKRRPMSVASIAEASRLYARLRDKSGLGGSRFPDGRIMPGDLHVSYNARVWKDSKSIKPEDLVFDPYGELVVPHE